MSTKTKQNKSTPTLQTPTRESPHTCTLQLTAKVFQLACLRLVILPDLPNFFCPNFIITISHSVPNTLRCLLVCKAHNSLTHTRIPAILSSTPPNQLQNHLLLAFFFFFFFSFFFFFFFLLLFSLLFFFFLLYTKLITKCAGCTSGLESCSHLS
jgi:hypothetical protein